MDDTLTALRKQYVAEIRAVGNGEIEAVISTEALDRDGDIIRASGWDLENYRKNPVVLWAHEYRERPIAQATKIEVKNSELVARIQFAKTDMGEEVRQLYEGGFLRAFSVGFMPNKKPNRMTEPVGEDGEERFTGYEYIGQELLEFSAVPVPANPEALRRALEKGLGTTILDTVPSVRLIPVEDDAAVDAIKYLAQAYDSTHKIAPDEPFDEMALIMAAAADGDLDEVARLVGELTLRVAEAESPTQVSGDEPDGSAPAEQPASPPRSAAKSVLTERDIAAVAAVAVARIKRELTGKLPD